MTTTTTTTTTEHPMLRNTVSQPPIVESVVVAKAKTKTKVISSLPAELTTPSSSVSIESGLDIILSHLEEPYFPRRISTYLTAKSGPWQILVNTRDEALEKFRESNLLDCRISAYRYPVPTVRGINAQVVNFVMCDLDRRDKVFKTTKLFNQCLQETLNNFNVKLHSANPTVIWSGNGYHILQPLYAYDKDGIPIVLETESIFTKFEESSINFMRYIERLMTNGLADSQHSRGMAFGNCMVRIPGSYNSRYRKNKAQSEVKIVQLWDGYRPNIQWLLRDYWISLIQMKNNEALDKLRRDQKRLRYSWKKGIDLTNQQSQVSMIDWIESIYKKPLNDFRRYCIWRIFVPYFINIRRLGQSETFDLVKDWLDRCSLLRRLDFNARCNINYALRTVRGYCPISLDDLKTEKPQLYTWLKNEGVIP
jgi:hypothetical protein